LAGFDLRVHFLSLAVISSFERSIYGGFLRVVLLLLLITALGFISIRFPSYLLNSSHLVLPVIRLLVLIFQASTVQSHLTIAPFYSDQAFLLPPYYYQTLLRLPLVN
jgi:hypothetical protein